MEFLWYWGWGRWQTALLRGAIWLLFLSLMPSCHTDCSRESICIDAPSQLIWPRDGATGVSVDTGVWFENPPHQGVADVFGLTDASGVITGHQSFLSTGDDTRSSVVGLLSFRPAAALAPLASYSVLLDGQVIATFTTGGANSSSPAPSIPLASFGKAQSLDVSCPRDVVQHGETVPTALTYSGLFAVVQYADEPAQFAADTVSGMVSQIGLGNSFSFTSAGCGLNWNGKSQGVRFGSVNAAGVFSGWTDVQQLSP